MRNKTSNSSWGVNSAGNTEFQKSLKLDQEGLRHNENLEETSFICYLLTSSLAGRLCNFLMSHDMLHILLTSKAESKLTKFMSLGRCQPNYSVTRSCDPLIHEHKLHQVKENTTQTILNAASPAVSVNMVCVDHNMFCVANFCLPRAWNHEITQ